MNQGSFDADRYLEVLQQADVLKVDIGIHVKGRICDSAFTMIWDPTYEKLVEAVKAATNTGVRVGRLSLLYYILFADCGLRKQGSMYDWASWVRLFKRLWNLMKSKSTGRCSQVSSNV
jgi:Metallopeptidase family M24